MSENEKGGWFARMKQGLSKSSKSLTEGLMNVLVGGKKTNYWSLILAWMQPIALLKI